jgi:hypothetical protein
MRLWCLKYFRTIHIILKKLTQQDAYTKCCSIGMQPLTLENDAEFECLNTLNKSETEKCDP